MMDGTTRRLQAEIERRRDAEARADRERNRTAYANPYSTSSYGSRTVVLPSTSYTPGYTFQRSNNYTVYPSYSYPSYSGTRVSGYVPYRNVKVRTKPLTSYSSSRLGSLAFGCGTR